MSRDIARLIDQVRKESEQKPMQLTQADYDGVLPENSHPDVLTYFTRLVVPASSGWESPATKTTPRCGNIPPDLCSIRSGMSA